MTQSPILQKQSPPHPFNQKQRFDGDYMVKGISSCHTQRFE